MNKPRSSRDKFFRITAKVILIFLIIICFAAAGILWYWKTHKKEIIRSKIEKAIADKSNGLYNVKYDSLDFDEEAGWMKIYNMRIHIDSSKFLLFKKEEVPPLFFDITIPLISVEGVKTKKAMLSNQLVAGRLLIKEPIINIFYTRRGLDSSTNVPTGDVYKQILGKLNLIQLDTVEIANAKLQTYNQQSGKSIVVAEQLSIMLGNVKVDSAAYDEKDRYLFAKDISLDAGKVNWESPAGFYKFRMENISGSSATHELKIGSFYQTPTMSEEAFMNALKFQDDRFDFSMQNILFRGIDLGKLGNGYLSADALIVGSSLFKIYRDVGMPRDNKSRLGRYPHQTLEKLAMHFDIKALSLPNSYIAYKERNNITRKSGVVFFSGVNIDINNVTNDRSSKNKIMTATVHSRFLGLTPFTTVWNFYLFNPQGRFDISAKLGAMDGSQLNQLTEPMGPSHIKQGQLDEFDFKLEGDDHSIKGDFKLLYSDLKIDLWGKDKKTSQLDKKFLTSLLVNIVIKNSNPKGNEPARLTTVNLPRDTRRSMFNLIWKAVYGGIIQTVGLKIRP